jgi:hypothetical protein
VKCTSKFKQFKITLERVVTSLQANPHFRTYDGMCNSRLSCWPSKWFQTLLVGLASELVLLVRSSTRVCFSVLNVAERFMHFHIMCTKMFSKFPFKVCNKHNPCYVVHLVPHSSTTGLFWHVSIFESHSHEPYKQCTVPRNEMNSSGLISFMVTPCKTMVIMCTTLSCLIIWHPHTFTDFNWLLE